MNCIICGARIIKQKPGANTCGSIQCAEDKLASEDREKRRQQENHMWEERMQVRTPEGRHRRFVDGEAVE